MKKKTLFYLYGVVEICCGMFVGIYRNSDGFMWSLSGALAITAGMIQIFTEYMTPKEEN